MTKNEMMDKYYRNPENNYNEACRRIKEAMLKGDKCVYLPGKNCTNDFSWCATDNTIKKLREDGYDIDVIWNPWEYWSIEWGY